MNTIMKMVTMLRIPAVIMKKMRITIMMNSRNMMLRKSILMNMKTNIITMMNIMKMKIFLKQIVMTIQMKKRQSRKLQKNQVKEIPVLI